MVSMLCGVWTSFQNFVTSWNGTIYYIILSMIVICALYGFMDFIKKNYGTDKKHKFGTLILAVVLLAIAALLVSARWA